MPELPEVEHTRRNLVRWMQNAQIVKVTTDDLRIVRPLKPVAFKRALHGKTIRRIDRRGKWLRVALDDDSRVFLHLGMTGWFEIAKPSAGVRFERVRLDVIRKGKPSRIAFTDPRRWGRMIVRRALEADIDSWSALGPDPLADGIDLEELRTKLTRRKQSSIKVALMDQKVLAGIGNIHAIEALWKAQIDPRSIASALDTKQLHAVVEGLRWTIERAIAELDHDDSRLGTHDTNPFTIYGHRDEPCPRCKKALRWMMLGGRSTTFCAHCQHRVGRPKKRRRSSE